MQFYQVASLGLGEALAPTLLGGDDVFTENGDTHSGPYEPSTVYGYGGDDEFDFNYLPQLLSVDGGPGLDRAVLPLLYGTTPAIISPGQVVLAAGSNSFTSVETMQFLDGSLFLDPQTSGGRTDALFQAILGRVPDTVSLGYWDSALQSYGAQAVAQGLLATPEAQARLGTLPDAGFVTALYQGVLDRSPEAAGLSYWTGQLAAGSSRALIATQLTGTDEVQAHLAPTFGAGLFAISPLAVAAARIEIAAYGTPDGLVSDNFPVDDLSLLRSGSETLLSFKQNTASALSAQTAAQTNAGFVNTVIQNAYGTPDPAASAFYTAQLDSGRGARADVLAAYAFSPGVDARVAPYVTDHGLALT